MLDFAEAVRRRRIEPKMDVRAGRHGEVRAHMDSVEVAIAMEEALAWLRWNLCVAVSSYRSQEGGRPPGRTIRKAPRDICSPTGAGVNGKHTTCNCGRLTASCGRT